jgi:hypothetical protein
MIPIINNRNEDVKNYCAMQNNFNEQEIYRMIIIFNILKIDLLA